MRVQNNEMNHHDTMSYAAEGRDTETALLNDLPIGLEQTQEVKGGPTCQNNLKQIGLAVHNYSSSY